MLHSNYAYKPPIDKRLEQWQGADLIVLKNISEGLYIEYKEDIISAKKIAKQLSAFANQYGGWLFFGIKEGGNERKAESFPGIKNDNVPLLLNRIHEISIQAIQPPVIFEEKVIDGPIPEIDLSDDNSIVIIGIPRGLIPPYIYSGKVYRRMFDKSEPEPETNHNIINELWKRRENSRKILENFTSRIPEMPSIQKKSTWAHIFLITDAFFEKNFNLILNSLFLSVSDSMKMHENGRFENAGTF